MRLFISCALLLAAAVPALAAPATPPARAVASGTSLASVTGTRVFPRLVGEPMPGWLAATGSHEMASVYEGYHEEAPLPDGLRLVTLRSQGLVGAYVLRGDRCVGELLFEPHEVAMPETLADRLRRAGFRARSGLLATRDRGYGVTAAIYERPRGADLEQYMLFDLPERVDGVLRSRTVVGAEAYYPAALSRALGPLIAAGSAALADFCRSDEEKTRNSAFRYPERRGIRVSMSYAR